MLYNPHLGRVLCSWSWCVCGHSGWSAVAYRSAGLCITKKTKEEWWGNGEFREQEGFELLGGVIAGMGSAAGLRLHSHLRFYPVLNSLNALLAFALLVCNWVQWGLGFKELFWGLQPCKLKAKAYKRWGCMVIFTRILKRPSLSCSLLCFCCCSAPARIPRDCSHSKQILRSHTASKSSGVSSCTLLVPSCHENKCLLWNLATESLRALTIDMGSRERSLLCGRDFSRWCHGKKYRMMTCFENTS